MNENRNREQAVQLYIGISLAILLFLMLAFCNQAHAQTVSASELRMKAKATPASPTVGGTFKLYINSGTGKLSCRGVAAADCMPGLAAVDWSIITNVPLVFPPDLTAHTWTGKQSFTVTGTTAPINLGNGSADPSAPVIGDVYYNDTNKNLAYFTGSGWRHTERTEQRNVANGYAGLDAGVKLNLAQMQEVMATTDLSDVSAISGTGTTAMRVTFTALTSGDVPQWNGTNWVNIPLGSGNAPLNATYITQTANGTLTNEQALSTLATGIVKVTTGTGVLSTAVAADFPTLNQNTTGNAATADSSLLAGVAGSLNNSGCAFTATSGVWTTACPIQSTAPGPNTLTNQTAPATPAAGTTSTWADTTDKVFKAKDDAGNISTTVRPMAANGQFVTGVGSDGVLTRATVSGGAGGNLLNYQRATSAVTGTAAEVDVYTYTMPANTIAAGECVDIRVGWKKTGTNTPAYKLKFGGTTIFDSASANNGGVQRVAVSVCNTTATNVQEAFMDYYIAGAVTGETTAATFGAESTLTANPVTAAIDTTASVVINFTQNVAATSSITGLFFRVVKVKL